MRKLKEFKVLSCGSLEDYESIRMTGYNIGSRQPDKVMPGPMLPGLNSLINQAIKDGFEPHSKVTLVTKTYTEQNGVFMTGESKFTSFYWLIEMAKYEESE